MKIPTAANLEIRITHFIRRHARHEDHTKQAQRSDNINCNMDESYSYTKAGITKEDSRILNKPLFTFPSLPWRDIW